MSAITLGTITWSSLPSQTLYACGCLQIPGTPPILLRWCGQPDCLRLAAAGIAYDARQWQWQTAHGGTPTMVAGLARYMRTPLPQTVPPPAQPLDPPGTVPFGGIPAELPPFAAKAGLEGQQPEPQAETSRRKNARSRQSDDASTDTA